MLRHIGVVICFATVLLCHGSSLLSVSETGSNDDFPIVFSIHADDFTPEWRLNVLRGYASRVMMLPSSLTGKRRVRIYMLDPGIVLQELLVR